MTEFMQLVRKDMELISTKEMQQHIAYARKHKHRKHNMRTSFTFSQEANDHSLEKAKIIAKCWKHFLQNTKIHVRRGYIVTAKVDNFADMRRFFPFARAVHREYVMKKMKKQAITNNQ